ncbi:MAG TPA: Hpt domain-containing protein [Hyphomicrobiaceae bacterium]|nr:Hpt domain-containing protein [Hyphomicrobiaceae bacterium]
MARLGGETREGLAGDPIDRAYLERFTLRNAELEREVLELFADQAPLYLERLRAADAARAWRDAAHTIKGAAAAIGAWRVARFAEMAELVDVEADLARREGHREEAIAAVAAAIDEACRFVARIYRGA